MISKYILRLRKNASAPVSKNATQVIREETTKVEGKEVFYFVASRIVDGAKAYEYAYVPGFKIGEAYKDGVGDREVIDIEPITDKRMKEVVKKDLAELVGQISISFWE